MERPGYAMESDLTFADVQVPEYAAVLCIGGRAPEYLRNDERVLDILRQFDREGKYIFAICHGLQLLASAGIIRGKTVTCYEHVRKDVETVGATYVAREAVRDGRFVSAPTWVQHPAFYREVFRCLGGD
jgi:protease I